VSPTDVLAQHLDDPVGSRHRLTLRDPRHLHCHDCHRTLVLPTGPSTTGSTSTSTGIPRPDQACRLHPGEWPDTCGRCRAEHLEARTPRPVPQPTFDTSDQARAKRRRLYEQSRGRTDTAESPAQHEERMAQARTELAARQPVPTPDEVTCEKAPGSAVGGLPVPGRYRGNPPAKTGAQNGVEQMESA
jgi:hypothetical protein